ncbi:BTAD domain-containing putative transcriptional regulator, partial [Enterovirga sp.]|uniref:BTAD domain-containing putative transcriptional regulator n=1 Tax=Enterovirga sp. TaxID=2026350 RepID=UPI002C4212E2
MRRALGAEAAELLLVEGGTVRLDRTMLDIDTDRLMAAAGGDLDAMQAAALLAGREFATELDGENNEILAEWLERQRTRFREASLALLARLARTLSEQGRHKEALAAALALHALDPLCEATHRLVIAEEALVS